MAYKTHIYRSFKNHICNQLILNTVLVSFFHSIIVKDEIGIKG